MTSSTLHEHQYWLPAPPKDFRALVKQLMESQKVSLGTDIAQLASYRLNNNQLISLSKLIKTKQEKQVNLNPLAPFRLGVLGNGTTCLYVPILLATAARYGVSLFINQAEYDQVMNASLDAFSSMNTENLDAVLLAIDFHSLPLGGEGGVMAAIDYLSHLREGLKQGGTRPVIFQTIVCPPMPLMGAYDIRSHNTLRAQILELNAKLVKMAVENGDYILDIAAVAEMIGTQNWINPSHWNQYKLSCAQELSHIYADHIGRLLGAIRGKSRKCLVLDLDNTVWGGIIGDDGINGIKIGQGDGIGEAYVEVQKMALALRDRGILIAVCSKNDDVVAREPFRSHPDMLLKEEHICVFMANWQNKASNLEVIAKTLNIGLDALVFMDDNPVEREQVRSELPMVAVPELPEDVSYYARTVKNAGYFEAVSFSEEDKIRAAQYSENAKRTELKSVTRDMKQFLTSLEMQIHIAKIDELSLMRATQLINKTNQFNLTTKRYTQNEIETFMRDNNWLSLQVRLEDKFGDNGLISVALVKQEKNCFIIDSWLMSCRVLGRRVEEAVLDAIVQEARLKSILEIVGHYIPSEKNAMVEQHYKKLGFKHLKSGKISEEGRLETFWSMDVAEYKYHKLPFKNFT